MVLDIDQQYVIDRLEMAGELQKRRNHYGEGFNLGCAYEYVRQNAVDPVWFREQLEERGLDSAIVSEPKPDFRGQG